MKLTIKKNWTVLLFLGAMLLIPTFYFGNLFTADMESRPILIYSEGDYFLWYEDPLTRVDKNTAILPRSSNVAEGVEVDAARNEYESFQVVFRSINSSQYYYRQFKLSFGDFTPDPSSNTPGNITIDSGNVTWYKEEYIMDEVDNGYADLLKSGSSFAMVERINHPYWIDIYVPIDASAGDYKSVVNVSMAERETFSFNVSLHVYNFTIPEQHSIVTTMGNSRVQTKIDMLQDRRISPYHLSNGFDYEIDTSYSGIGYNFTFDWTDFDLTVEEAVNKNLDSFRINYWAPFEEFTDEYNTTMINWYKQAGEHLDAKGWLDLGYVYIIDEPGKDEYYRVKNAFDVVHQGYAGLRTMITTNPDEDTLNALEDCVDIWCPPIHSYDLDTVKYLQGNGIDVWAYPCLYPKVPYFNFMLQNQLTDPRLYFWKTYSDGLDGCLYWSTDWYHYSHGGYGFNGMGDGILIYEDNNGQYSPSIRIQSIRDGIEDLEYFKLLNQLSTAAGDNNLQNQDAKILEFLDLSGELRVDRDAFSSFREEIAEKIESYY